MERVRRVWWMRFIPKLRVFRCYECYYESISFLDRRVALPAPQAKVVEDMYYITADECTYGPVNMETLSLWARMGRLHGDHAISKNKEGSSVKAENIKVLGMNWVVVLPESNECCVLHPHGVKELFKAGLIPPDANVRIKDKQIDIPLNEALRTLPPD
jgi:hypothetical protein